MSTDRPVRNRLYILAVGAACALGPAIAFGQGQPVRPPRDGQQGDRQGGGQPGERGGGGGGRGGFGGGGFGRNMMGGDPMSPSIDSRELESIAKNIGLSSDQKDLAKGLFEGYQEQFRAKSEEWRAKFDKAREEARESGDPRAAFQNMGPMMAEVREQRQKMEDQFFSDYKAILTPDQQAKWPTVERDRRREKTIGMGRLSGERMDVAHLVEQAKLPEPVMAQVRPLLDQYSADLDRELVSRNKIYEEAFTRIPQMMGDPDQMQKALEKGREASVKVRDINRRYARQIEAVLPDDLKASWQKSVKEANFPDVYRASNTSRQITAAEGFGDLDAAQKESIKALKETYARELEAANEKLAAAQEKNEMTITADRLMRGFGGGPGGGGRDNTDDPTAEARQQKRDLEQRTGESLKKILTPEQADRLPTQQRGGPGGGPGGGGGDNGDRPRQRRNGGNQDDATPRRPDRAGGGGGGGGR